MDVKGTAMTWPDYGDPRVPERFWEKVYPEPNTGCWLWAAGADAGGYGRFRHGNKMCTAWVVAYHALVGPAPDGPTSTTCDTPMCVFPGHRVEKAGRPKPPTPAKHRVIWPSRAPDNPVLLKRLFRAQRDAARSRSILACMVLAEFQAGERLVRVKAELRAANAQLMAKRVQDSRQKIAA